jgi:hypothetical protein
MVERKLNNIPRSDKIKCNGNPIHLKIDIVFRPSYAKGRKMHFMWKRTT